MTAPESATKRPVLQLANVRKHYGNKIAVADLSFDVAAGEIVGLLGPNGAGKTTTINMVLGVLEASSGQILIDGHDVIRQRRRALAATNFAAVYAPLPGNLTVEQNLRIFGLIYGVQRLALRIDALLQQFDLLPYRNTRCGVLSSGEQTRVCLAKALLNQPRLLLLDEPTASLDPATARDIRLQIQRIAGEQGGGILWTSHNMTEVEDVCDRILILSQGRVLLQGNPRTLAAEHGANSLEDLFVRLARDPGAAASRDEARA